MVLGFHDLDHRARAAPHLGDLVDRVLVGAGRRREDGPSVLEQLGEAGLGPGEFGAGYRMAGDEMDALRDVRSEVADRRLLGRTDVGKDRAGLERRADLRGDLGVGAEVRAQDDEVGILGHLGGVERGRICETQAR